MNPFRVIKQRTTQPKPPLAYDIPPYHKRFCDWLTSLIFLGEITKERFYKSTLENLFCKTWGATPTRKETLEEFQFYIKWAVLQGFLKEERSLVGEVVYSLTDKKWD